MLLKNKVAIVTGGTKGIGLAICNLFLKNGAKVIATYVQDDAAAAAAKSYLKHDKNNFFTLRCDIKQKYSRIDLLSQTIAKFGTIDILVNNAGVLNRVPFLDIDEDSFETVINTNLKAPYWLTQMVAKHMVTEKIEGSIINISSIDAKASAGSLSHYELSKAAISMFSKSLARELGQYGIRANSILPGLTKTNINKEQWQNNPDIWHKREEPIPLGRAAIPDDIAQAVLFLASPMASYINGAEIIIDGGLTCYVPQGNALSKSE